MSFYASHILGPDTHANRPAASGVPDGALYMCSTHSIIYRNNAGTWGTWATLAGAAAVPVGGSTGQVLAKTSGADYATGWSTLTSTRSINAQTGTTYTAGLADADRAAFLTMSNASAIAFTIPPNSSVAFPVGSVVEGGQLGAGQVTLTPGAGVTINGTPGLKIAAQYGTFGLLKTATDVWLAYGRLAA